MVVQGIGIAIPNPVGHRMADAPIQSGENVPRLPDDELSQIKRG